MQASQQIALLIQSLNSKERARQAMRTMMNRESDFSDATEAKLTAIALDPVARELAEGALDNYWGNPTRRENLIARAQVTAGEVIIGSGYHAAVYAAIRSLSGYPKPIVLERGGRAGGVFAVTERPVFYLNSRNRPGNGGFAGDMMSSLNYLPGAPLQADKVSATEYQTNADMAFVIRLALAQHAQVITNAEVSEVSGMQIILKDRSNGIPAKRIIDARGLGDPIVDSRGADSISKPNGETILTFPQFMRRMGTVTWPLRNLRKVAVIGGGDSGKCAVESFLGIAPQPYMTAMGLDMVTSVDIYGRNLPTSCEGWLDNIRGRYQAIGRYLRNDRNGFRRLSVINRIGTPVAVPGTGAVVNGQIYDMVVVCSGNGERNIDGLETFNLSNYAPAADTVALKDFDREVYRVGPHAGLAFSSRERDDNLDEIPENRTAIFRLGPKTAQLAAALPPVKVDSGTNLLDQLFAPTD